MSSSNRSFLAFLTGVLTGVAVGIVFAPDKGEATRDKLTYRLAKYRDELQKLITDLLNNKDLKENAAKSQGEKVVNEAREKAEKLLEDVDRLMEQIKNQTVEQA